MSGYFTTDGAGGFWLVVQTVPELTAIPDAILPDGASCDVRELLDPFVLDKASTAPLEACVTVATASGVGRWLRRCTAAAEWTQRPEWHVNQATGNDRNDGATAGTALASYDELFRRIGTGPQRVPDPQAYAYVYQHGDYTGDVNFFLDDRYDAGQGGGGLILVGVKTLIHAGVLTAGTIPYNPAANVVGLVEDTTLGVSWTASGLVKRQLVLAAGSSAPGAYGWIAKQDAAPKKARCGPVFDELGSYDRVDPVSGDPYEVYTLPKLVGQVRAAGAATLMLYDLDFDPGNAWDWPLQSSGASSVFVQGCKVSSGQPHFESASLGQLYGCLFGSGCVSMHCTRKGEATYTCCTFDCKVTTTDPACATLADCLLEPGTNPTMQGRIHIAGGWACVQDAPALSTIYLMGPGAVARFTNLLWGQGNQADYAINCAAAALYYTAGVKPTVGPNSVSDCNFGPGGVALYGALPIATVYGTVYTY